MGPRARSHPLRRTDRVNRIAGHKLREFTESPNIPECPTQEPAWPRGACYAKHVFFEMVLKELLGNALKHR